MSKAEKYINKYIQHTGISICMYKYTCLCFQRFLIFFDFHRQLGALAPGPPLPPCIPLTLEEPTIDRLANNYTKIIHFQLPSERATCSEHAQKEVESNIRIHSHTLENDSSKKPNKFSKR